MEIFGRQINFSYNVLSQKELAKICPGRNIKRLNELLISDDTVEMYESAQKIIIALNAGYEKAAHYNNPEYVPNPVTIDMLDCLDETTFIELLNDSLKSMKQKQEIETEPDPNVESPKTVSN